jgi:hypothetical protein
VKGSSVSSNGSDRAAIHLRLSIAAASEALGVVPDAATAHGRAYRQLTDLYQTYNLRGVDEALAVLNSITEWDTIVAAFAYTTGNTSFPAHPGMVAELLRREVGDTVRSGDRLTPDVLHGYAMSVLVHAVAVDETGHGPEFGAQPGG